MEETLSRPRFVAVYSESFNDTLIRLPDAIYDRIEDTIDLLEEFPFIGHPYRPQYEAKLPPVDCMQTFVDGTYCALYYVIDEDNLRLKFFYLGDTRQNPLTMFQELSF